MTTDVADLTLKFDSTSAKTVTSDMDKLAQSGQKLGPVVELLQGKFGALMAVLGPTAVAAAFAEMLKSTIELEAGYVRLAQIAGTTSSNISGLALPAALAGTSLESMAVAMAKLNREVGLAKLGDFGNKSMLLRAIGVDPASGQDPAETFLQVARALVGMQDQTIAAKVAFDLLGRSYAELKPAMIELIEQGGIHARTTDEQNKAAKELADTWVKIKFNFEESAISITNSLIPSLQKLAKAMLDYQRGPGVLSGMLGGGGTGNPGGGQSFNPAQLTGSQADVRALDNAQTGGGAPAQSGPSPEQQRVQLLLDNQKFFAQRLADAKASGAAYTAAIKTDLSLTDLAYKEFGATSLRAQEQLLKDKQVLNDADLVMQAKTLEKQRRLELGKDPTDMAGKAKEAQTAIALVNQKRVNDEAVTAATIQALRAQTQQQELAQAQQLIAQHEQAGEAVADSLDSVRQAEMKSYNQRQADLDIFLLKGTKSEEEAARLREALAKQHEFNLLATNSSGIKSRVDIEKMGGADQLDYYTGTLMSITSAAAQHNRAMFEANKAASIANAVVKMYEGATAALSWGWPLGPIFAGIIVAAGLVNINAIRSASFGGGAASPSVGAASAGGATPVVNVPQTQSTGGSGAGGGITVIVQGHFYGTPAFMNDVVLPAIQDAVNNKDFLLFNSNSRQATVRPGAGLS